MDGLPAMLKCTRAFEGLSDTACRYLRQMKGFRMSRVIVKRLLRP